MMAALIVAIPPIEADTTSERLDALNDLYEIPRNSWYDQYDYLRVDGRYYWMDWSQDGCSIPVPSSWTTLFLPGCLRHDLAWRTLPVIDDDTGRVWNERT